MNRLNTSAIIADVTILSLRRSPRPRTVGAAVKAALAASAALAVLASGAAGANPQQGTVIAGNAAIDTSKAGHMQIDQTSSKAIINWGSFSVGSAESVTFAQPNANSATLNRVVGNAPSVIDGALAANGQVLILNSAGILFGRHAEVNVGSLIATTSDIDNKDFLGGKLDFHAPGTAAGAVVNEGTLRVADQGLAALVAPTVRNSGVIQARLGKIALGSGEAFTVDLYGDHLINFAIGQNASGSARAIDQQGTLIADGGKVLMSSDAAAGVVSNVVNMSGVIQARTVSQTQSGEIILDAPSSAIKVSGTLDASSASGRGGSIAVNGASVELSAGGRVDASATQAGSGGSIVLFGTDSVAVAGTVSSRGGVGDGDGGTVDVSTHGGLSLTGAVDVGATHGSAGALLLDPASITVAASGSSDPTASTVSAGFLSQQLQSGTDVTLQATDSISVQAAIDGRPAAGGSSATPSGSVALTAGSLTIASPIVTDRGKITLDATSGSINFSSGAGGDGFLWVANCASGCPTSNLTAGAAAIQVQAAQSITTTAATDALAHNIGQMITAGDVQLTATSGDVSGLPVLGGVGAGLGSLSVTAGGNVSLAGARTAGAITVSGASVSTGGSPLTAAAGGVDLHATAGDITINSATSSGSAVAAIDAAGGGAVTLAASGNVNAQSGILSQGPLSVSAGGNVTLSGATVGFGTNSTAGSATATITAAGNVTLNGNPLIAQDGITIDATGGSSVVTVGATPASGSTPTAGLVAGFGLNSDGSVNTASVSNSTAAITLEDASQVVLNQGLLAAGTANVGTSAHRVGTVTGSAPVQASTAQAGAGTIDVYASGPVTFGNLLVSDTGTVSINSADNVTLNDVLAGFSGSDGIGGLSVTSGKDLLMGGATVGQSSAVAAGAGTAQLSAAGNFETGGSVLIARDGISITAGSGLTVDALTGGAPALVAGVAASGSVNNANSLVTLLPANATALPNATLNGGVVGEGGVIVGSSTGRFGNVSASGSLQAGGPSSGPGADPSANPAAAVNVYAAKSINLAKVLAGSGAAVTLDTQDANTNTAGSVTVGSDLGGFGSSSAGSGIGSLTVHADGAVQLTSVAANHDITINTGGTGNLVVGGTLASTGGNVALTLGGGCLLIAAGTDCATVPSIFASTARPLPAAPSAVQTVVTSSQGGVTVSGASSVWIPGGVSAHTGVNIGTSAGTSGSIALGAVGAGSAVTVASTGNVDVGQIEADGAVSVSGARVQSGAIAAASGATGSGPASVTLNGTNEVDVLGSTVSAGALNVTVANGTPTSPNINLWAPLYSLDTHTNDTAILIGEPAHYTASINLSNNVYTNGGSIAFDGNVTLFYGVVRTDSDPYLSAYANLIAPIASQNQVGVDTVTGTSNNWLHLVDYYRLLDSAGNVVSVAPRNYTYTVNGQPTPISGTCSYFACPTEPQLAQFIASAPTGVDGGDSEFLTVMSPLTATISTHGLTSPANATGGAVTFQGSVNRYSPDSQTLQTYASANAAKLAPQAGIACASPATCTMQQVTVPYSFVNTALSLKTDAVTFKGTVGDPTLPTPTLFLGTNPINQTSVLTGPPDTNNFPASNVVGYVPLLGTFMVDVGLSPANNGQTPALVTCNAVCASNTGFLYNPSYQASDHTYASAYYSWLPGYVPGGSAGGANPHEIVLYYQEDDSNQGQQDIGLNGVASNGQPSLVNVAQASATPIFGTAPAGVTAGTGAAAVAGSSTIAGATTFGGLSLDIVDSAVANAATEAIDGAATADSRRQTDTSSVDTTATAAETNTCPHGAGQTADLGQLRGVSGASPNVFARCSKPAAPAVAGGS